MSYGIVTTQGAFDNNVTNSIFLSDVSNASAVAANSRITLRWSDPEDVLHEGVKIAEWANTIVVRKEGSVPQHRQDGTTVLVSNIRNFYSTNGWVDAHVMNGITYYYRFFPCSTDSSYTDGIAVSARPAAHTLDVPTIIGTYTYTGENITPTIEGFDGQALTKFGDLSAINAGTYSITFKLISNEYIWSDGTYEDKTVSWVINKADNNLVLSAESGTVTYGEFREISVTSNPSGGLLSVESSDKNYVDADIVDDTKIRLSCRRVSSSPVILTVHSAETVNYKAGSAIYTVTTAKAAGRITATVSSIILSKTENSKEFKFSRLGTGNVIIVVNNSQCVSIDKLYERMTEEELNEYNGSLLLRIRAIETGNARDQGEIAISVAADSNYTAASLTIPVTVQRYKTMTIKIDQSNSNPETCCTYADDAVGMLPGSYEWDEWFGEYPCLLGGGLKKLNLTPTITLKTLTVAA